MRKLGGAAIHMQPIEHKDMKVVLPEKIDEARLLSAKIRQPFEAITLDFFDDVSRLLLKSPLIREYPDVTTLAFWMRKSSMSKLKADYMKTHGEAVFAGKGIVFHITPSNVAVNFMYSLVASMLAGNNNIIKLAPKEHVQESIIIDALVKVLEKPQYSQISDGLYVVKYGIIKELTDYFSSICDVRIVWGGDATIAAIRTSPLPPRSTEILFADRYSFCVIDAKAILDCENLDRQALGFFNDTYLMDQNACSSPRLVVWRGEESVLSAARKRFWEAVRKVAKEKYELVPVMAVDKYTQFCRDAITHKGISFERMDDNYVYRIIMKELPEDVDTIRGTGGYFVETSVYDLSEIAHIVNKKYQTLTYYGISRDDLKNFVLDNNLKGIDRIVPLGAALDFGLVWDGYDLIGCMSRECVFVETVTRI